MTAIPKIELSPPDVTIESQESLLERLIDSYAALKEVKNFTDHMGAFVVHAQVQADRLPAATPTQNKLKRKREDDVEVCDSSYADRTEDEEDDEDDEDKSQPPRANEGAANAHSRSSAKRMLILYQHLQRTQTLLEEEMEMFIDETEASCHREDEGVAAASE